MKSLAVVLVLLSTVLLEAPARAEDTLQSVRSAGKLVRDASVDLGAELEAGEPLLRAVALEAEDYASSPRRQRYEGIANRHDQLFEIFSADARPLSDIDGDGFHHAINVSFDVDVNYDDAAVYAKLYLSRDGGPWSQYFTTDLFYIYGDSADDIYEVETELVAGYYAGYYAVLIEIYSLDHAYMVASEVLDYHTIGRDLMLEDLDRDSGYVEVHGAAGIGAPLLMLMLVQVVIAARRAPALSPLKKRQN